LQAEEIQNQLFKEQNQSAIPGRRLPAAGEVGWHAATPYEMRLEQIQQARKQPAKQDQRRPQMPT